MIVNGFSEDEQTEYTIKENNMRTKRKPYDVKFRSE